MSVEQTTNMGGGRVWPLEQVRAVLDVARAAGLSTHLDGARLMNAVVASGVDAADWAGGFDSAWLDFTKGLGAPVGACLAGSAELHRGGVALEADARRRHAPVGHRRRRRASTRSTTTSSAWPTTTRAPGALAEGLAALPGVELDPATVQTNIVIFAVPDAAAFTAALAAEDVEMSHFGPTRVRAVTHLDVDDEGIERALAVAAQALG